MMKVIVDDKIPYIRGRVERLADEVVYLPGSAITATDVRHADALIVRTRTVCNRQLLQGSRVRFIVTATIGYDHLDTAYLDEAGIAWTNCPGCNATSVAQYVRNSLLLLEQADMVDLANATVGIVGMGHVGCAVHEAVSPYVGRIWINDPPLEQMLGMGHPSASSTPFCLYNNRRRAQPYQSSQAGMVSSLSFSSLDALMSACDIITFHTPLIPDAPHPTFHLAGRQFLDGLRRNPVIINAARGGVVDDAALECALDDGRVRAAVIDTWEGEPNIRLSLLRKSFIATPHIAGYSANGKANATRMSLEALAKWLGKTWDETDADGFEQPKVCRSAEEDAPQHPLSLYNPMEDSRRLKQAPERFEYLRGHYPVRYEQ